jgi:HEXXH motif-containing protein
MLEPLAPPEDLTIPRAGSTTTRTLLSRALRRLLGDLGKIDARLATGDERAGYVALLSAVREAMARDPGAVWSAVRRPTIGALIRYARFAGRAAQVLRELVATVSIELALAGALERTVRVPAPPRVIGLGSRQVWALPAGTIACGPDGVFVEGRPLGEFVVAAGFLAIEDGLVLACVDNNPLAAVEAHPDKQGNAIDLGGRAAEAWVAALREALAIIKIYMPELAGEMAAVLQQVVPVGYDEGRHVSASYQEAIGTVYLSLHPNAMTMVEALIHEFSHNKFNVLFELDAVLENAFSPLYPSPVRPDPRPLHGVLLAVHAFLPVARLYADMLAAGDPRAEDPGFIRQVRGDRGGQPRGGGGAAGARAADTGRGGVAGGD